MIALHPWEASPCSQPDPRPDQERAPSPDRGPSSVRRGGAGPRRGRAWVAPLHLAALLAAGAAGLASLATGQGPADVPPSATPGPPPPAPDPVGAGCPPGSQVLQEVHVRCYPDCSGDLAPLNWGGPPLDPVSLAFPKFETDGCYLRTLREVRIDIDAFVDGSICLDNLSPTCNAIQASDIWATFPVVPSSQNSPPISLDPLKPIAAQVTIPAMQLGPATSMDASDNCPDQTTGQADDQCELDSVDHFRLEFVGPGHDSASILEPEFLQQWTRGQGLDQVLLNTLTGVPLGIIGNGPLEAIWLARGRVRVTVTYIYCSNVPPTCETDMQPVEVLENGSRSINLLDHVSDIDGCLNCSTFTIVTGPSHGKLIDPDCDGSGGTGMGCDDCGECSVLYTPDDDYCGPDSFTFTVEDDCGALVTCTVDILVTPVNVPPNCNCDGDPSPPFTTYDDTPLLIDLCALSCDADDLSDCGAGLDCEGFIIVSPPDCGGSLTHQGGGRYLFTPPLGHCGDCQFSYRAVDHAGLESRLCTIHIWVERRNRPPICADSALVLVERDSFRDIDLCALSSDPDEGTPCGAGLDCEAFLIVAPPDCGGTLVHQGGGVYRFTPPAGYCGPCEFSFRPIDGDGATSLVPCRVPILVHANDPPICFSFDVQTGIDQPILIDFGPYASDPNDHDECGFPWGCDIEFGPVPCGSLVKLGCALYEFIPVPGFCGTCVIPWRPVDDGGLAATSWCEARVEVDRNDPPQCNCVDPPLFRTQINQPLVIDLCLLSCDPNDGTQCGHPLDCNAFVIVAPPDCGGTLDPIGNGRYRFTPPLDYLGTCRFTYRAVDGGGLQSEGEPCPIEILVEERCEPTGRRRPGSLLLYPEFDNRSGVVTTYSITNTSFTQGIEAKFWYVDRDDCSSFDRKVQLTPRDTLTLITNFHNPGQNRGYCYVVAQCWQNNRPVVFDHLIGQLTVVQGIDNFGFAINAVAFPGIGEGGGMSSCELRFTDVNGNTLHELDGIEYGPAPDQLLIPRFFGQDDTYRSELILIGLSGGKQFTTTVDFMIYNDNEEAFSSEYTFYCWTRVPLLDIDYTFSQDFLSQWTNNDPEELFGDPTVQTGWMEIQGFVANSPTTSILHPAVYAVLIEKTGPNLEAADLPWGRCSRETGALLSRSNSGQ